MPERRLFQRPLPIVELVALALVLAVTLYLVAHPAHVHCSSIRYEPRLGIYTIETSEGRVNLEELADEVKMKCQSYLPGPEGDRR